MKTSSVLAVGIVLAFTSCQNNSKESIATAQDAISEVAANMPQSVLADSVQKYSMMSTSSLSKSAVKATPSVSGNEKGDMNAPERKIIRTAAVKSEVQNTEQSTYKIEQIAKKYGGFITANSLTTQVTSDINTPVSSDSVLNTKAFQITNNIVVRVPNRFLDTFLYEISPLYTRLDLRNISSEDVTAAYLSNTLKAEIRQKATQQMDKTPRGKADLSDVAEIQNTIVNMKDEAIEKQVENLETNYKIQYSQVNLEIYQPSVVARTMQLNPSVLNPKPSFGYRFVEALKDGGQVLVNAFILVVNMWAVILIALLAWLAYRKYGFQVVNKLTKSPSNQI